MASAFPSSGFFAGGSWAAERLTAAAHTTVTVSTENIHLISGSSLQKRVYTTFARERATKTKRRSATVAAVIDRRRSPDGGIVGGHRPPLQLLDNRFFLCRTWHAYSA